MKKEVKMGVEEPSNLGVGGTGQQSGVGTKPGLHRKRVSRRDSPGRSCLLDRLERGDKPLTVDLDHRGGKEKKKEEKKKNSPPRAEF